MLPPIPQGLVPVTVQQDQPKPRPEIKPVTPAQDSSGASDVGLKNDDGRQVRERLHEEQRKRQQQAGSGGQGEEEEEQASGAAQEKKSGELSRRGLWIDVKV